MTEENKNINEEVIETVEEQPKKTTKKKAPTKKVNAKPKKKTKAQLKKILKEAEVVVMNNFGVKIRYEGNDGFELELLSHLDSDIVEVEELRKMHVKKKAFFNNYWLLITEVICDDEDVTLEDVYEYIGISKLYKDIENPDNDFFENLLLEVPFNRFKEILKNLNKQLVVQLFVRATELYKEKRLFDSFKITEIEKLVDREDCFKDIKSDE